MVASGLVVGKGTSFCRTPPAFRRGPANLSHARPPNLSDDRGSSLPESACRPNQRPFPARACQPTIPLLHPEFVAAISHRCRPGSTSYRARHLGPWSSTLEEGKPLDTRPAVGPPDQRQHVRP